MSDGAVGHWNDWKSKRSDCGKVGPKDGLSDEQVGEGTVKRSGGRTARRMNGWMVERTVGQTDGR